MNSKKLILSLVLVLFLVAAGVALANGVVELPRWVMSGAASDSAAGDVTLSATLGQPVVGTVSGGDVALGQGFWPGVPTDEQSIYLPIVLK
jgi:hypothetical protein